MTTEAGMAEACESDGFRGEEFLLEDGELRLELVKVAPHPVHGGCGYFFRMLHVESGEEMGRINLRFGSSAHLRLYAGHVGYAVEAEHQGHRYASRALRLLKPVAARLTQEQVWVTCDPENVASRRSCELAGAELVEIVEVPETCVIHQNGHPRKCRYLLAL